MTLPKYPRPITDKIVKSSIDNAGMSIALCMTSTQSHASSFDSATKTYGSCFSGATINSGALSTLETVVDLAIRIVSSSDDSLSSSYNKLELETKHTVHYAE